MQQFAPPNLRIAVVGQDSGLELPSRQAVVLHLGIPNSSDFVPVPPSLAARRVGPRDYQLAYLRAAAPMHS